MDRTKIIRKNVSLGLLFKFLNMLLIYITIPYLLVFLGKESYGVWVTIFSIINLLFYIDAGVSNGLKTKLSHALSEGNIELSKEYISTGYIIIFTTAFFFFIVGYIFLNSVELTSLLNISSDIDEQFLKNVFLITLIFVVTNFILSLYKSLFYSIQKAAVIEISMFMYQALVLIMILLAIKYLPGSLYYVALIYGIASLIIGIFCTTFFFTKNKNLIPNTFLFNKDRLNDLMGLSIDFFVIQLCMIVIFTSDNILISNLLGPSEVANYDISLKLFQVLITLPVLVLEPFWALFADAYQKNDYQWIKLAFNKFNKLFIALAFGVLILVISAKAIIKIWIGETIVINNLLIKLMGIFVLVRVYGAIYMVFLNGIGKIKLQKWLYVFGAIINIPLSIYLVKEIHLGSSGIILGTIFSLALITLILPIQSFKILNKVDF